jgi:hypothetical protein
MFLIIGRSEDTFCRAVQNRLKAQGYECSIIGELFHAPGRAAVTISEHGVLSQCKNAFSDWLYAEDIQGVYIGELLYPHSSPWAPEDYQYVTQEITSAFLGWLATLQCPVLNRYDPRTWYMRSSSVLAWRLSARRCRLEISDRWSKQTEFGRPSRLYRVAAIGGELIWDLLPPIDHERLTQPVRLFMELNRLSLLQALFSFERGRSKLYSIMLGLYPQQFSPTAQQQILGKIVALLLGGSAAMTGSK